MIAVAVAVSIAAAGCSSEGGGVRLSTVGSATAKAESARIRMAFAYDGVETSSEGVVDFVTGDSRLENRADGVGQVTISAAGELFVGPRDAPDTGPAWVRMPKREEVESPNSGGFNPERIVRDLKESSASVQESGNDRIRGDRTTTYRFTLNKDADHESVFSAFGDAAGTLDVGEDGRLRRLILSPKKTSANKREDEFPIPETWTIELWDYGVDVDVSAPTDRVVDFDDEAAGSLMAAIFGDGNFVGPDDELVIDVDPTLSGPFVRVAAASWEEIAWEVWRAPTTDGRVCETFELTPPRDDFESVPDDISHNGHSAACQPKPGLSFLADALVLLDSSFGDSEYWYVAGTAAPEIVALDVTFRDGATSRVPVDQASGVFVMFDRETRRIKEIRPDAGGKATLKCVPEEDDGSLIYLNCSGGFAR